MSLLRIVGIACWAVAGLLFVAQFPLVYGPAWEGWPDYLGGEGVLGMMGLMLVLVMLGWWLDREDGGER